MTREELRAYFRERQRRERALKGLDTCCDHGCYQESAPGRRRCPRHLHVQRVKKATRVRYRKKVSA